MWITPFKELDVVLELNGVDLWNLLPSFCKVNLGNLDGAGWDGDM
jgi:hypothetical protein